MAEIRGWEAARRKELSRENSEKSSNYSRRAGPGDRPSSVTGAAAKMRQLDLGQHGIHPG